MRYGSWTITEADGELHASIFLPIATIPHAVHALNANMIDGYTRIDQDGVTKHILHTTGDNLSDMVAALDSYFMEYDV